MILVSKYQNISKRYFKPINATNCDIGGKRLQNTLWRFHNLLSSPYPQNAVIMCNPNNIQHNSVEDLVDGILGVTLSLRRKYHPVAILPAFPSLEIITGQSIEFI